MVKKIAAVLLAVALLITGCNKAPVSPSTPGETQSRLTQPYTTPVGVPFSDMVFARPSLEETNEKYLDFAGKVKAAAAFEDVLGVWQEEATLSMEYYDMYTLSYILFSQDTSNETLSADYDYMQDFISQIKPVAMEFTQALLESPYRAELDDAIGPHVLSAMQVSLDSYSEEQIELDLKVNALTTEYVKLNSDTAVYTTDEYTFTASDLYYYVYMQDGDNSTFAAELLDEYYRELNQKTGDIYSDLMKLRTEIAALAGYDNFLDYYYNASSDSGYTRKDVEGFRAAVKKYLVPIYKDIAKDAAKGYGQDKLNIFQYSSPMPELADLTYNADIHNPQELADASLNLLRELSPETKELVDFMSENGLYDLLSSPNKRAGAFTIYFYGSREPFVVSSYEDPGTYIHEMGHALNFYRTAPFTVLEQDLQSSDISEIHSQTLELLAGPLLGNLYSDGALAEKSNIFDMFHTILSATLVDEFQHALYEKPNMTTAERNDLYKKLSKEYFGEVDSLGLNYIDDGMEWTEIHHLFSSPMYYLEYALTAVVALNFWEESGENWDGAFAHYIDFVDIPNDINLMDSLAMANLPNIFEEKTIKTLSDELSAYFKAS